MGTSQHLDAILDKRESATNLMVVFVDIVSYSRRRTVAQKVTVDALQQCLRSALTDTASESLEYIQRNGLNFSTDVVFVPTGDGAAVAFSFDVCMTFISASPCTCCVTCTN